jgi:tetratricopeptide (TPR) repeat protein
MILKVATVILVLARVIPPSENSDYLNLRQDGVAEFRMGHYARAEELIRAALKFAETSNDEYAVAISYSALGDIRHAKTQFPEARRDYLRAISLLSHHRERAHAVAILWRSVASALTGEARYGEALAALKKASKLVARNKVEDPQLNAQILNSLGVIHYHQAKMAKAEDFFLKATKLQFTARNWLDVDLWEILNNLGRVYQVTRRYGKAEDTYRRSLQLAEVRLGPSHPSLSVLLDNLGSLYAETGRYGEAEAQHQRSLSVLEQTQMPVDEIFAMRALYGLGNTYLREGDRTRAQTVLARAAEIASRRVLASEMMEALDVLDLYGRALKNSPNSAEAERVRMEARRIRAFMSFTVPLANAK